MSRIKRKWLESIADQLPYCDVLSPEIVIDHTIRRSDAEIVLFTAKCHDNTRQYCAKKFTSLSAEKCSRLFERTAAIEPILNSLNIATPQVAYSDVSQSVLIQTFVSGRPLEDMIIRSFFQGHTAIEHCCDIIRNLAITYARIATVPIPDNIPMATPCSGKEYAARLARFLSNHFVRSCLYTKTSNPERIVQLLPDSFWQRHEKRLLHGDFQAKNVLVDNAGKHVLIDWEFGIGHPLFDVAQFLTQLVRLSRRWNFPRATRLLKRYGNVFLDNYYSHGWEHLRTDLPFFAIWATTFSLISDEQHAAPVRAYIRHHLKNSTLMECWIGTSSPNCD